MPSVLGSSSSTFGTSVFHRLLSSKPEYTTGPTYVQSPSTWSAVNSTITERNWSPFTDRYMHHLPMVSFQITSGAHVLPSRSGLESCFGHACQISPSSAYGSRLRCYRTAPNAPYPCCARTDDACRTDSRHRFPRRLRDRARPPDRWRACARCRWARWPVPQIVVLQTIALQHSRLLRRFHSLLRPPNAQIVRAQSAEGHDCLAILVSRSLSNAPEYVTSPSSPVSLSVIWLAPSTASQVPSGRRSRCRLPSG